MVKEYGTARYITSGDDNTLMLYDINERKVIGQGKVQPKTSFRRLTTTRQKGGASSQSSAVSGQQSRALNYNHKYNHLAVARNDGKVSIRLIEGSENTDRDAMIDLDNEIKLFECNVDKKKSEWIECLRYSPNQEMLAVGSHDNFIYIYSDVGSQAYTLTNRLVGHSSAITALDWSLDNDKIRSVCQAYELMFFEPNNNSGFKNTIKAQKNLKRNNDGGGASNTTGTDWDDHTCEFGWRVEGIFPSGTSGDHVNAVKLTKDQNTFAVGDDHGHVCIYNNPARPKHKCRILTGHSEHVTCVAFYEENGDRLISTGGQDQTVIQWKRKDLK